MDEPKPCPFCGNAGVVIDDSDMNCDAYMVVCERCGASGQSVAFSSSDAIAAWNRRAPETEIAAIETGKEP